VVVVGGTVEVVGIGALPSSTTVQRVVTVVTPLALKTIVYVLACALVFAVNLAKRETLPVLHFTVVVNPAIFGVDDQPQLLAFFTAAVKVTEPPVAPTVLVAALA
jgi:hypothetical protein